MELQEFIKHPGTRIDNSSELASVFHQNNQFILSKIKDKIQRIQRGSGPKAMDFTQQEFTGKNEKFIGAMVTQFDYKPQNAFEVFIKNIDNYLVCLKSDGMRFLLAILSCGRTIMIDRENNIYEVSTDIFTDSLVTDKEGIGVIEYILDGELVQNESLICSKEPLHFQIFDMILYKRNLLIDKDCLERIKHAKLLINLSRFYRPAFLTQEPPKHGKMIHVYVKDFYPARQTSFPLQKLSTIDPYAGNIDGLIFTKINYPYYPGRHLGMIKWKHERMNTIDFLIVDNTSLLLSLQTSFKVDQFFVFELYVANRDKFILFDYLFVFNMEEYVEICRHFKVMNIGNLSLEGAIFECSYNKEEDNESVRLFWNTAFDMSSDSIISLINSSKMAKLSVIDHESIKCLLTAFDQRRNPYDDRFAGNWERLRIRADKSFPNSLATANSVYSSIFEKSISERKLLECINSGKV